MRRTAREHGARAVIFMVASLLSLTACTGGGRYRKEALEEKKILQDRNGYSPKKGRYLQQLLVDCGLRPGSVDGRIGRQTRDAIREFQKTRKIRVTGYADDATWTALSREVEDRSKRKAAGQSESGDWVKKVQRALRSAGFDPGPADGKPGKKTKKAIIAFQEANGIKADGVVGVETWEKLKTYFSAT